VTSWSRRTFHDDGESVGVAHVPDERLDRLAAMSESKKVVYASVEVVDIAGLVAGAERARVWATACWRESAKSMRSASCSVAFATSGKR